MTVSAPELVLRYTPRGASADIFKMQDPQLVISGPAGTGKSRAILEKVHLACLKHPNLRALMVRKTRRSLTESAMVTYEKHVLGPELGTRVLWKSSVQQYQYRKNGSILAVAGLDKSSKIMSSEWDLIYVQEATELTEDDWEACTVRLRNGKNSYQQLIGDCNPDAPTHWLKQRANSGKTPMLESRHEDNPLLFREDGTLTEEGERYIGMLEELTGVRLARYRYGIWAAASGTVYEQDWDRARNVIDRFPIPREWPRYMVVDFGYTNPFCCKWYAMDNDGRFFSYREIYHTKRLVEDHAKDILIRSGWFNRLPRDHPRYKEMPAEWADPLPREIICDHDAEDRATLERHLGFMTSPAHKSVRDGIQATAARYRNAGDGKPRLMHFRDALVERDQELSRQKKPICTIEEPESYVWAENTLGIKEEPVKENDHGMDTDRYMVARFDLQPSGVTYYRDIWR